MAEKDKFKKKGNDSKRSQKNNIEDRIFRPKEDLFKGFDGDKGDKKNTDKGPFVKNKEKREDSDGPKLKTFKSDGASGTFVKKGKRTGKKKANDAPKTPEYNFTKINKAIKKVEKKKGSEHRTEELVRLNRFVANAGVCSRREADVLIANGEIKVNGNVVKEMGFKVGANDNVMHKGVLLNRERKVYVLLNKPKGYITTTDDPDGRRTVMDLIDGACQERIYPVGRLDRATSGLLLFTNDGELATALAHPSGNVKKVYRIELTTSITEAHFEAIKAGVTLEDGFVKPDSIAINDKEKHVLGVEIHSGRNRIVRRMFEHFGYVVDRLDRTSFAGLTKKDIPRGHWRYLTEGELLRLKHFEKHV